MRHLIPALLAVLSLLAFSGPADARKAQLRDPDPIAVPQGEDADKLAADIKRALIGRGWTVTAEAPGQIDSTLFLREHVARIRVTYDEKQVHVAYVNSENLDYSEKAGVRYIHRNYLGWIGFLIHDLTTNMQVSTLQ